MSKQLPVIWMPVANTSFLNTLSYIVENWSEKEGLKFNDKVQKLTHSIASNKHLCPLVPIENVRRCVISKQNSLTYTIENNCVYIIAFIDNRTNHKY